VKGISYPNIGNSSLESWVPRFEKNLKPSTLVSLSASGSELVDEIVFQLQDLIAESPTGMIIDKP